MSKYLLSAIALLISGAILSGCKPPATHGNAPEPNIIESSVTQNAEIERAYTQKLSDVQVLGHGEVVKLLSDDNKGSRHQRFLVKINNRQTLLFAHNIDLAPRIPLQIGDKVTFHGEYVYNPKGGIIHWTHHDPKGAHVTGWVMLNGRKYQ
ncbi:MAG: hypothetical protein CVU29_04815 [Betaproteobacteria bacterium HGW-Betaproteobacteria-22]|nr:MAG: hypothetical protein CVU29_04815 [Betaproteobacteria bacterium HGW-Betaproteobacteria-22]